MTTRKWFAYCADYGFKLYETEKEAEDAADSFLDMYRESALFDKEWDEDVLSVCYGRIYKKASEIRTIDANYLDFHLEQFRDEMKWTYGTPTEPGYYWCRRYGRTRMVNVWRHTELAGQKQPLFTNEDGGALITDQDLYSDTLWYGPILPPYS